MNILTCGCFDLIHTGHIDFLNRIKDENNKLFVLVHSDRFISTYKRKPILNEKDRLKMILNIKCVDNAFIDDNEYLSNEIITKYNINYVYQAIIGESNWNYYYIEAEKKKIMKYIEYNKNNLSTTEIINKISIKSTHIEDRYSKENILKSEKLYGKGYQSPGLEIILERLLPNKKCENILEIGSGLGGNCMHLYTKYMCNIIGLDLCKSMIEISKERNNNNKITYLLENYSNFDNKTKYDIILSRDVFMYITTEQLYNYFQKIKKELSEDGILILIDYCSGEKIDDEFKYYCMNRNWNLINKKLYNKIINDVGLKIVDENSLNQEYIRYFENKKLDIEIDVKNNLDKKIEFLKKNKLEWYYFIISKNNL